MKRTWILALGILVLSASAAFAQAPTTPQPPSGATVGANFVDANGDGVCDLFQAGNRQGQGGGQAGHGLQVPGEQGLRLPQQDGLVLGQQPEGQLLVGLSAQQVGPSCRVIGGDSTPERLALARRNLTKVGAANVNARLQGLGIEGLTVNRSCQKLIGDINLQAIQIYKTRSEALMVAVELYKAQLDGVKTGVDVDRARIEGFRETVNAYKAMVEAIRSVTDVPLR